MSRLSIDYLGVDSFVGDNERDSVPRSTSHESLEISGAESFDEADFGMNVKSIRFGGPHQSTDMTGGKGRLNDDDFSSFSLEDVSSRKNPGCCTASVEGPVSINSSEAKFTKLEVIKAKEISKLLWWFHGFIMFGMLFSVVFIILANTTYLRLDDLGDITARYYSLPSYYEWILSILNIICFLYAVTLATVYTSRMVRIRRQYRTHEQVWVILLTIAAALYLNPYENVARIMAEAGFNLRQGRWYDPISRLYDSLRDASFTASTIFYIWATVHSYRVVSGNLGLSFYIPKVLLVIFYMLLKQFAFWRFNIYTSEMPVASLVAMLHLYRNLGSWPLSGVICVALVTIFEFLYIAWIVCEIRITRNFLKSQDYMKSRTNQIGFRFFLYHNLTFYFVFWICYLLLLLGLPPGAQLAAMKFFSVSYVEIQYVPFGLTVLYLSYVTVEAYVNLPVDAIGLRGWLRPQAPKPGGQQEPITYQKRECPCHKPLADCFVMETHVVMFNYAWLVYYYDTPKMSRLGSEKDRCRDKVYKHLRHDETDTQALIIDDEDRIVVVFKGTSNSKNLRTDLNAFHVRLSRVLPTALEDTEGANLETPRSVAYAVLGSRDGTNAKIHRGFGEAYMSVAKEVMTAIQWLLEKRFRPVYLTGHSLGGALATICAYDCVLRLKLGAKDLYVATYGSPRVGNGAFRRLYDESVPASWRVTIAPDIVTKLPKVGYEHVGKKVMLTTTGELFLDPTSLELSFSNGDGTSLVYHRKSSYLLAMKSWCNRFENGSYKPSFWNWPSSADDERRWPDATPYILRMNNHRNRHRLLVHNDAMIDALDGLKVEDPHERAIENWSRFSRRLLLSNKLHETSLWSL